MWSYDSLMSAHDLEILSIKFYGIAHGEWTPERDATLKIDCDDWVDFDATTREFWGTDDDGSEWRVHLKGPRS